LSVAIEACVAAACFYGVGSALQSIGAKRLTGPGMRGLAKIVREGHYVGGLACDFAGWLLALYGFSHLPLFAVQTILAGSVAVTVAVAWLFVHAPVSRVDGVAIAAVVVGLVLVGLSAGPASDGAGGTTARVALVIGIPLAGLVGAVALRGRHSVIAAVVAGTLFCLGAASVRTLTFDPVVGLLGQPMTWVAIAYFASGLVVHARALQIGDVGPVTAALWASEVLVGAAVGAALFDDRVRSGALALAIVGMVVALGATVQLSLTRSKLVADPTPFDPTP
jgi:hypothetical protein